MNETRFQYIRTRGEQNGNNTLPTILVQDAFISGGSQGLAHNDEDRWELQNYSTWTKGRHILRFGARLRGVSINDFSPQNFGGTFIFSGGEAPQLDANNQIVLDENGDPVLIPITSLERYRRTLLFQGNPNMRELGGGVTQFSIAGGNPEASVKQTDMGLFVQDEWRIRPNLTFTMGLRYERQTNISSNYNFAPRLFFAWAPGGTSVGGGPGAPSSSSPKMVIRGGIGVFYDRFGERATLLANRFNGTNQLDFRVFDPQVLDTSTFSLNGVSVCRRSNRLKLLPRRRSRDVLPATSGADVRNDRGERRATTAVEVHLLRRLFQLPRQAPAALAQHQRAVAGHLRSRESE